MEDDELFDEDDLDGLIEELGAVSLPPTPNWRATIRRGKLTVTDWAPFLIGPGPSGALLASRERAGITIADLTIYGDGELGVRYWTTGTERATVDRLLAEWATALGYTRLWLPDQLLELDTDPGHLDTAAVTCPTCRSRWSDSSADFWLGVRKAGLFPKWCPMCGCEMPQWSIQPVDAPRDHEARRSAGLG